MSTHKTVINDRLVETFLEDHQVSNGQQIEKIADGESSQAFFYKTEEGDRVLRINAHRIFGFQKEQMAQTRFGSIIPIPKIYEIGEIETGIYFAISERATGKTLDKFSNDEKDKLVSEVVRVLDLIHSIEPFGSGYGSWDLSGNGKQNSWREVLEDTINLDDEETKNAEFYDNAFHDQLRDEIRSYFEYCTDVRQLVHADFGFNNATSDGSVITAVFDWEHSMYGDPLYDVAWLDFWDSGRDYKAIFAKHYQVKATLPENFEQRIQCYKLAIGLSSMGFYARSRQPKSINFLKLM